MALNNRAARDGAPFNLKKGGTLVPIGRGGVAAVFETYDAEPVVVVVRPRVTHTSTLATPHEREEALAKIARIPRPPLVDLMLGEALSGRATVDDMLDHLVNIDGIRRRIAAE
jgi:hypothetical protein